MPEKNHYFPIFYQKRWAGADGQVCLYSKPYKELKAIRRHPSRIGFQYDLYTIPGVDSQTASHLERRFFLQTDNDAAEALSLFETDPKAPLNQRVRSGWTRFVISLIHRAPEEVAIFTRQVAEHLAYAEKEFEQNYSSLRRPDEPETFVEFKLKRPSNLEGRAAAILIQRVIDNQAVGNRFNRMIWTIVSPPSTYTFVTSDRPIVMTNGLNRPDSHLAIPIGPRKLFIASNEQAIVDQVVAWKPDDLVSFVNNRVVLQARRFCIGTDDRQLRFVANRFGAQLPSSPTEMSRFPSPEEMAKIEKEKSKRNLQV
jgi:hypothetical protein